MMALFIVLISGASTFAADGEKAVKVPFELLKTQHMVVEVKINGKGPFRLIFDTGAPVTLINNRLAKEAQVIPKNFRKPLFAPFGSVGQFKIKTIQIGDAIVENMPTMVMDHPTVSLMSKLMGPLDGIVGFSFFSRFKTTIDYQSKEMTFVPNGFIPPDLMEDLAKNLLTRQKNKVVVLQPRTIFGIVVEKKDNDESAGVDVTDVFENGPAAKAGLRKGDRLLVLDDHWTDEVNDVYRALENVSPGTSVRVTIERNGKRQNLSVRLESGF